MKKREEEKKNCTIKLIKFCPRQAAINTVQSSTTETDKNTYEQWN